MRKEIEEFIQKLRLLEPEPYEDISSELYELVEPIEELKEAELVIPELFNFMECNPEADIGSPGALIHLIEQFYPSYLELLIGSVERQPTQHTVWMINRILNSDLSVTERERLLMVLRSVQSNPNASTSVKEEVGGFLEHQSKNG